MYPVCLLLKITLASVKAKNLNMRQYVSMQTNQRIKIQGKQMIQLSNIAHESQYTTTFSIT